MSSRSRSRDRSRSRSRDRSRSRSRSPGKSPSPKRGERSWSRSRSRSPRRVTGGAEPRSIYVAGFSPRVPASEVETLFRRFGDVQRVDMKKGFAFVFMYNDDDSRDAIKDLNNSKFDGARLRVEFAKGSGATKRREVERAEAVKSAPTRTLFMVNFDEYRTRESDIKDFFKDFDVQHVAIKKNYAFVEFPDTTEASAALNKCNGAWLLDRQVTLEFKAGDMGARGPKKPPPRRSPPRGSRGGRRGSNGPPSGPLGWPPVPFGGFPMPGYMDYRGGYGYPPIPPFAPYGRDGYRDRSRSRSPPPKRWRGSSRSYSRGRSYSPDRRRRRSRS